MRFENHSERISRHITVVASVVTAAGLVLIALVTLWSAAGA
jgi:hypothetical protein